VSKVDCEWALRQVERYIDGELDQSELETIRIHLEGCPPCMDRALFKRHLKQLLATRCGGAEVPESLTLRIRSVMQRRPSDPEASGSKT
jgi:anti-sigma factor (TIGR02949 family)